MIKNIIFLMVLLRNFYAMEWAVDGIVKMLIYTIIVILGAYLLNGFESFIKFTLGGIR